jgi:hypothetical protein
MTGTSVRLQAIEEPYDLVVPGVAFQRQPATTPGEVKPALELPSSIAAWP